MQTANHKSGNAALDMALEEIGHAFRAEREERQHTLLQGCRVQELVEAGRYSFPEACRLMQVSSTDVMTALEWLVDDNARMNALYDCERHYQGSSHFMMAGWMREQEKQQPTAKIISFPIGATCQ